MFGFVRLAQDRTWGLPSALEAVVGMKVPAHGIRSLVLHQGCLESAAAWVLH